MKSSEKSQNVSVACSFKVFDCAPVFIATGLRAYTLRELLEDLRIVHAGSIQHHFWGRLLRPVVEEPEYSNDFAAWAGRELRDPVLAERLSVLYPTDYGNVEELRGAIIDLVEERLDEEILTHTATAHQPFYFLMSQLVVIDTGFRVEDPAGLNKAVREMSEGSVYYHFIDARRRNEERCDDFSAWVRSCSGDHEQLSVDLAAIDPYFSSLGEIRLRLENLFGLSFPPS